MVMPRGGSVWLMNIYLSPQIVLVVLTVDKGKQILFETDPCVFCSSFPETLEHLFIVALFTSKFKWLSMKINNILSTVLEDILLLSILVY